jgi:prophage maintenance system killer protein
MYAGADVPLPAAVLAHGIAESQVVVDGNKRTALIALLTFVDINGWMLDTDDVALRRPPDQHRLILQADVCRRFTRYRRAITVA